VPLLPSLDNGFRTNAWASDGLLLATAQAERERLEAIARGWRYYDGDQPPSLVVHLNEPDDNVTLNVVETAVDAVTDFMFGEQLAFDLVEREPDSDDVLYVNDTWRTSGGMRLLGDIRTNGAVAGHAFVAIDVYEGQNVRLEPARLRTLDPATVMVLCDPDDYTIVHEYRITWNSVIDGKLVAKRKRIINEGLGWTIVEEHSPAGTARWIEDARTAWAYTWPPIVDTKNLPRPNVFWGRPDIDVDLMRLQDAINAVGSDARRVSRLLGHAQTWATGVQGDELSADPGEVILLPDEARMGTVGPPSTPSAHMELLARFKAAFHEQARVPEVTTGKLDGIGQLSGLALGILYGPLTRKVGVARGLYGHLLDETNRRLLDLGGFEPTETQPRWPSIVPSDPKADAETAEVKQRVGVSRETTVAELGYDAEVERERRQAEAEDEPQVDLGAALGRFNAGTE
jgi:hypothetical protein